ncbi:dihydrofolate reductase [Kocuria sp. JC486]|uniref:Dihydrofolate reductase n=1 Tax=Kocuria soli TaxID=2485125 RepID=A0A3N3ZTF8_9MICC|nr:dihydrofolate reductase [Kocuria soli]NHU84718.1 dihydrofolate reductase [Kocuria sp. JC486]ROZ63457.1 dihydrofolate reductase [Kocuria soli]
MSSEPAAGVHVPEIAAIWAQTRDGVIGDHGSMPWHLPEDFQHFKRQTLGHPVIMGRRTWESFPPRFRPLPGRTNVVVTSRPEAVTVPGDAQKADDPTVEGTDTVVVGSYADAVAAAAAAPGGELVWVIGGGQLYAHAMADPDVPVTRAVVSVLDLDVDGDTRAPELGTEWHLVAAGARQVSRTGTAWHIETWQRH